MTARWWHIDSLWRERRCRACARPYIPSDISLPHSVHVFESPMLCADCAVLLAAYAGHVCQLCGLPQALSPSPTQAPHTNILCGTCLQDPPPWEFLHSFALYEGLLQSILLRFKYGQEQSLIPLLGAMLARSARACLPCDIAVPVPQHPVRLRERGMNQAHELTRYAAQMLSIPLRAQVLWRTRLTAPQVRLRAIERKQNPKGSFAAANVHGHNVLLCDDTMTTGATLTHAATALRAAGARAVRVAVVARAALQGIRA